jgi:hypothetical protein
MHMDAILRITAILQADADAGRATDKHRLVDDLHLEFPLISRVVLLALVESSIATIDGASA